MPWKIVKGNDSENPFCVVKESDGKTVKCHPTREKAKSHLAALYVNEPSAAKKSLNTGYGLLKSLIVERVEELKACGANKPGGGGFSTGNTCARGGKSGEAGAGGETFETRYTASDGATIHQPGSSASTAFGKIGVGDYVEAKTGQGSRVHGSVVEKKETRITIQPQGTTRKKDRMDVTSGEASTYGFAHKKK